MRSLANLANRLERRIAGSHRAAGLAAKVRNQCDAVIGYHLADTPDAARNGEMLLLDELAQGVHRFMDVGANVGDWTVELLRRQPTAEGIAVEPAVSAVEQLRHRVGPRVRIVDAAAGAVPGSTVFFDTGDAGEVSSLVSSWAGDRTARQVRVVTVDGLLSDAGWDSLDFLKIDAEGFDCHVLEGASTALAEGAITTVQFEYNRPWRQAGRTLGGAISLLESTGYVVRAVTPAGPRDYAYEPYGEFFAYSNFVATRR